MAKHMVCTSKLAEVMNRCGMPVLRLARMVGLSPSVIRRYMRGQSEPSVFVAMLLADALLCELHQLWQVEVIDVPDFGAGAQDLA